MVKRKLAALEKVDANLLVAQSNHIEKSIITARQDKFTVQDQKGSKVRLRIIIMIGVLKPPQVI